MLIQKAETRAAAVTMLGKMIEYCSRQLATLEPDVLSKLKQSFSKVKEPGELAAALVAALVALVAALVSALDPQTDGANQRPVSMG